MSVCAAAARGIAWTGHENGGAQMTRSLFDPTGGDMAEEGDRFTGRAAENISHMPEGAVDGKAAEDPDAQVPLKGPGEAGLDPADTEKLTTAAGEAVAEENDPDGRTHRGLGRN